LSLAQRVDRVERLLRGGVPKGAADEAERIVDETRDAGLALRALKVIAEASQRLGRYDIAARTLELAIDRAPADRKPGLRLEQARLLLRDNQKDRALAVLAGVEASGAEAEAAEAAWLKARTIDEPGRESAALTAYRAVASRFPNREVGGGAQWRVGWLEYLRGDWRAAERTWTRLLDLPGGRGYRLGGLYLARRLPEGPPPKAQAQGA